LETGHNTLQVLCSIPDTIARHNQASLRGRPDGDGGARRDRTADPLLAKQVLSQLSYGPENRPAINPG
jgi:hypothetical protein